jgi:hypothetical protein
MPCGGIMPPRSLRTTFSQRLGVLGRVIDVQLVEHQPAILAFSLWQVTQY